MKTDYFIPTQKERSDFLLKYKNEFPENEVLTIGRSILSRDIDCYKFGSGKRHIIYVGAHHAMEHITSSVLYDFIDFFARKIGRDSTFCGINLDFLKQKFTFWVIPCLNPDGVEMNFMGASKGPLTERQLRMNGGDTDFSKWQANARGVDLNHNYDAGFFEYKRNFEEPRGIAAGRALFSGEHPESEPEVRAILRLIRSVTPSLIMSFHTQGMEIYPNPKTRKVCALAERAAGILGYTVKEPTDSAAYGGLSDYTGGVLGIPSLTLELGRGENPIDEGAFPLLCEGVRRLCTLLPTYL